MQDKLSAKATKCVFLGYSCFQRGYQCYSPDINRYLISTDVTFFEDSSFFSFVACPPVLDDIFIPVVLPSPDFPSPLTDAVTRPLQIYTRHPCPPIGPLVDSSFMPPSSLTLILQPPDDLPIAIRKGTRSTCNPHSVYNFLSFHHLSSPYFTFISTLSSISTPKSTSEALSHPMAEEMDALYFNGTWELIALLSGKFPIGCRWVCTMKVKT